MPWLAEPFYIQQQAFQAACSYVWPIDRLIHLYKYQARLDLLPIFTELLLHRAKPDAQALLAIPLSQQKLASRGFNQSLLLAQQLSKHWNIPLWQPLERHAGLAQRQLSREERLTNLEHAFYVNPAQTRVIPRKVLVIDDVITTGSTFMAIQTALHALGVTSVECLAIAKAV